MDRSSLLGKRFIALLRCSSVVQVDTSIDDQRRVLDAFARDHGMVHVGEIALEGVSGSTPGNRSDIQEIIDRKLQQNDFDIVLVHDTSRLTRAGIQHAHSIEFEFQKVGITIEYVMEQIPQGEVGNLIKSVQSFANNQHAKSISMATTRGSMSSILDNRSPYARRPPYAVDRLYLLPDGTPLHIIRNLADGTQVQLHPTTGEVLRHYGVNSASGRRSHYIKQRSDRVMLVPGDPNHIAVVHQIYRRSLIDNWGMFRIAEELNVTGVQSPTGLTWNKSTIQNILMNPIYLGEGIANRLSCGVYHNRSVDRPVPSKVSPQDIATRKRPPSTIRPKHEWHIQRNETLVDFLPAELRDLARARQKIKLDRQAYGETAKPNRDRHRNSEYFLKGILRSKQGNHPLTGRLHGRRFRYYAISKAVSNPGADKILRRLVPAEPLEQIVIETLRTILVSTPNLRELIEQQVRASLSARHVSNAELKNLHAKRKTIIRKLSLIIDEFDTETKLVVADKLRSLQSDLKQIDNRIAECDPVRSTNESMIPSLIDQSVAAVENLAKTITELPKAALRRCLEALIVKLTVDLETLDASLEIRLPFGLPEVGLVERFASKSWNETHAFSAVSLRWDAKSKRYQMAA